MLLFRYRDNELLNTLYPERQHRWLKPTKRRLVNEIDLNKFSFIDEPNQTMHNLHKIVEAECEAKDGYVNFRDPRILDIGPYVVLAVMSSGMAPFLRGGVMDTGVKKVIEAVNLRTFMGIRPFAGLDKDQNVWAFRLRQRHPGPATATPPQAIGFSKVADELVDTVGDWLAALPVPLTLSDDAREELNKIVTEMLDNAERHGKNDTKLGDWYVAGFMGKRGGNNDDSGERPWYDCHLAFVNLGRTIAETLLNPGRTAIPRGWEAYRKLHRSPRGPSESLLATVWAMQDGVTSIPGVLGGLGMMEMVQMCNKLGGTSDLAHQPTITIISGRSCIQFAGPYKSFLSSATDARMPRRQPFNQRGTFNRPPDSDYVFDLDHRFPGTIVALRFSFDHEAIYERLDEHEEHDDN